MVSDAVIIAESVSNNSCSGSQSRFWNNQTSLYRKPP